MDGRVIAVVGGGLAIDMPRAALAHRASMLADLGADLAPRA